MKTALVTGCNKGIGFCIAKELCKKGYRLIMGCRDQSKANEAEDQIKACHPNACIKHVVIDLENPSSIATTAEIIKSEYGCTLDVLVNNAGFAFHQDSNVSFDIQAETSVRINYKGTRAVCEALAPLVRKGGRIVNVSSGAGSLNIISSPVLRQRWESASSPGDIDKLTEEFIHETQTGEFIANGWPESAYGVSKLSVTTYTRILGKMLPDVHVFSCCPGWCRTDMSSHTGMKSAEDGADTPLWLATSSECLETVPQGGFVSERRVA